MVNIVGAGSRSPYKEREVSNMKKYTVNGYKNGHLVESHETNEICSAYEQYRHLGTPQGEIVDTEYSEVFESYGFEE